MKKILLPKWLQISFLYWNKNKTTFEKVIQANLVNVYYIRLCKSIKTCSLMKYINTFHLSCLVIDTKNYICQFDCFYVADDPQLIVIRYAYNHIATKLSGYRKIINIVSLN